MGILGTLCIFVAVLGVILIILGVLPVTSGYIGRPTVPAGVTLLVLGVVLYILISLLSHSQSWGLLLLPTLAG